MNNIETKAVKQIKTIVESVDTFKPYSFFSKLLDSYTGENAIKPETKKDILLNVSEAYSKEFSKLRQAEEWINVLLNQ
jgi:hypothetical protein